MGPDSFRIDCLSGSLIKSWLICKLTNQATNHSSSSLHLGLAGAHPGRRRRAAPGSVSGRVNRLSRTELRKLTSSSVNGAIDLTPRRESLPPATFDSSAALAAGDGACVPRSAGRRERLSRPGPDASTDSSTVVEVSHSRSASLSGVPHAAPQALLAPRPSLALVSACIPKAR